MALPTGTYYSDPAATHAVEVLGGGFGSGVYGYYTNEFDAHRVRRFLKGQGAEIARVVDYDPADDTPSIHPLVEAGLKGYAS
jgi:hypothetical protein